MRRTEQRERRRTVTVQIRLTEEEHEALLRAAQAAGAPLSTWLRMLGLDRAKGAR